MPISLNSQSTTAVSFEYVGQESSNYNSELGQNKLFGAKASEYITRKSVMVLGLGV